MKKIVSLLLVLACCLSLCACGAKTEDAVVGKWVYKHELTEADIPHSVGDVMSKTIELYKGGTGRIYWHNDTSGKDGSNVSLSWEINDDIINISYNLSIDVTEGYVYDAKTDTITKVDNTELFNRAK